MLWITLAAAKPVQVDNHCGCTATVAQDWCHLRVSTVSQVISEALRNTLLLLDLPSLLPARTGL